MTGQLAVTALLLLASAAAIPEQAPARYTVEIVVFRTADQAGALPGSAPAAAASDDDLEFTTVGIRKLAGAASRLRNTSGYRILAQTAWTQTPINCSGADCRALTRGISTARVGLSRGGVIGNVVLKRGQFLNLGLDLDIEDGGRHYHLSEVRKVKIDEAQYFDHPAVGVLAVVTTGN